MSKLPTPAERLRSLLAAAGSLTLHVPGRRCDLVGAHSFQEGQIRLELKDSLAHAFGADAAGGSHPAPPTASRLLPLDPDTAAVLELRATGGTR